MKIPGLGLCLIVLTLFSAACRRGGDRRIARVGRSYITEAEFKRKLSEVAPDYRNYVLTPNGQRQFLDVLIREKLVLESARSAGIHRRAEYRDQLEALRKEEEEKLREAADYLLTRMWFDELRAKGVLTVADAEVKEAYAKHPKEVQMRHILVASAEEAEEALKQARSAGFAQTAQKLSLDADTAAGGGRMPPAVYGELIGEFEPAWHMKVGEIAGPVRSKFGYHVLFKESERTVEFEKAAPRLHAVLEKEKLDHALQSQQPSFPVEVLDAQFK
ncbi:MAG: peptidylprolyl isomerase [Elusimicrobiota bacterium]|jgi:parvulin-like peptidyl-prolyl isomerase